MVITSGKLSEWRHSLLSPPRCWLRGQQEEVGHPGWGKDKYFLSHHPEMPVAGMGGPRVYPKRLPRKVLVLPGGYKETQEARARLGSGGVRVSRNRLRSSPPSPTPNHLKKLMVRPCH